MFLKEKRRREKRIKRLIRTVEVLAFLVLLYLVVMPFYPEFKYSTEVYAGGFPIAADIETVKRDTDEILNHLPETEFSVSPDRVIITKIGVNAPIVESNSADYGLSQGSWHFPGSSSPDKGGNMVITGHRFKYLPPSNLTFYLFHKLEKGDIVSIIWKGEKYFYRIKETKIVENTDMSILEQTDKSILTMFTCHPIYSTEKRLVIVSELIEE